MEYYYGDDNVFYCHTGKDKFGDKIRMQFSYEMFQRITDADQQSVLEYRGLRIFKYIDLILKAVLNTK